MQCSGNVAAGVRGCVLESTGKYTWWKKLVCGGSAVSVVFVGKWRTEEKKRRRRKRRRRREYISDNFGIKGEKLVGGLYTK